MIPAARAEYGSGRKTMLDDVTACAILISDVLIDRVIEL